MNLVTPRANSAVVISFESVVSLFWINATFTLSLELRKLASFSLSSSKSLKSTSGVFLSPKGMVLDLSLSGEVLVLIIFEAPSHSDVDSIWKTYVSFA